MDYQEKLQFLRILGDLQGEMAAKGRIYRARDDLPLAMRFERASFAALNARLFMQAALMAEREAIATETIK